MLHTDVYCANIATLSCNRRKRNAAAAEAEGQRRLRVVPAGGPARARAGRGRRPEVAIPGRIRMSLLIMKSAHEPVVAVLAGMVQEQPATRLAGMDPAATKNIQFYVKLC